MRCNKLFSKEQSEFIHDYANVLGVKVSAINMKLAINIADRWIHQEKPNYICVTGVHGIMEAKYHPELRHILNSALVNAPDGMPMSWVGHLQGHSEMDRVFGPDFMMAMCQLSAERGYRNFFYGGKPGVAKELGETLTRRFPNLQVVGTFTPPFRDLVPKEEEELMVQLQQSRPHILWVGLSTPKQEIFMAQYVNRFQISLLIGVGAAFDYHTGRIQDCSDWIKRAGLQWFHRLLQDPRHLWQRYLKNNPAFLWNIAFQIFGLRRYPIDLENTVKLQRRTVI